MKTLSVVCLPALVSCITTLNLLGQVLPSPGRYWYQNSRKRQFQEVGKDFPDLWCLVVNYLDQAKFKKLLFIQMSPGECVCIMKNTSVLPIQI